MPHAGICAGGRSKERSLPRSYIALLTQNQDAFSSAWSDQWASGPTFQEVGSISLVTSTLKRNAFVWN